MKSVCFECRFWSPLFDMDDLKADPQFGQCKRRAPVIRTESHIGYWPRTHSTPPALPVDQRQVYISVPGPRTRQ